MKTLAPALFLAYLFCLSCHSGKQPSQQKEPLADTASFYPLADFFKQQIQYVDLRNFHIYRLRVTDGKKDSADLDKEAFAALADGFLQKAFSVPGSKAFYKETVFEDLSTDSYTLSYTATDPSMEVSSIDILLNPKTRIIKRVFIKSRHIHGDTTIEEQASWKADKSFRVNRSLQTGRGFHSVELNYINWNDGR